MREAREGFCPGPRCASAHASTRVRGTVRVSRAPGERAGCPDLRGQLPARGAGGAGTRSGGDEAGDAEVTSRRRARRDGWVGGSRRKGLPHRHTIHDLVVTDVTDIKSKA